MSLNAYDNNDIYFQEVASITAQNLSLFLEPMQKFLQWSPC